MSAARLLARAARAVRAEPRLLLKAAWRLLTHGPAATLRMGAAVARTAAAPLEPPAPEPGPDRPRRVGGGGGRSADSVVVPLFDTPAELLRACIVSVLRQAYERLGNGAGGRRVHPARSARPSLRRRGGGRAHPGAGPRRQWRHQPRPQAQGWSWRPATGPPFLDHDDELTPDALLCVAERIVAEPELDALYTDQHKIDAHGRIIDQHLKPDWSPALMLGVMYVGHLLVARTDPRPGCGAFDPAYDGVQDSDFMLRLSERTAAIGHIARPALPLARRPRQRGGRRGRQAGRRDAAEGRAAGAPASAWAVMDTRAAPRPTPSPPDGAGSRPGRAGALGLRDHAQP